MAIRKHGNNLRTFLLNNVTASGTSLIVDSVAGFPTIGAGEVYRLTLSQNNSIEIVEVTAVSVNTLTVTRGMENTTGKPYTSGAIVELRATADSYDRKQDLLDNTTTTTVTPASTDRVLIQDASDSYKLKNVLFSSFGGGGGGGSGDVVGPASATANTVALFDGTTGKLIKSMTAPAADRIIFYDFSANTIDYLTLGTNLSITGTTINATGGGGSQTPWTSTIDTAGYSLTNSSTSSGVKLLSGNQGIHLTSEYTDLPSSSATISQVLRFLGNSANGSGFVGFRAPATIAGSATYTWPATSPASDLILQCNSSNVMSWVTKPTGLVNGTYNDITVSGSANVWSLNTSLITLANNDRVVVQDVSASNTASYVLVTDIAQFATKLGTIAIGVWQGTAVGTAYGGTGQTTYTNGQLLIGNTTGNTLTKGTITSTGNSVVVTNGAGTINLETRADKTAFKARRTSTQTVTSGVATKVQNNVEVYDAGNRYDNATNYRYTPDVAGVYVFTAYLEATTNAANGHIIISIYKNGVEVTRQFVFYFVGALIYGGLTAQIEMNGTTDYVEMYATMVGTQIDANTSFSGACLERS